MSTSPLPGNLDRLAGVAAEVHPDETLDAICRGEVLLIQRRGGYRFSIDPLLLASFVRVPEGPAADLGTGCGILPLLLARRGARSVVGVELQMTLFKLAWRNVQLNRLEERVQILNADMRGLRGLLQGEGFDLVVSNPPYVARGAGNVNPDLEKAIARHELTASLPELARSARYLLRRGGAFAVVFPASRLAELLGVLPQVKLTPRRLRMVHTLPDRPAKLVLLEAIKEGGEVLEVSPPLFVHEPGGGFSAEVRQMLGDSGAVLNLGRGPVGQS